jgi:hypothetical protein
MSLHEAGETAEASGGDPEGRAAGFFGVREVTETVR